MLKIVHQLVGIALTRVRYAFKNAQTYQHYYPDSNPLLRHMRKVRTPGQTDDQHDETNDVQGKRHVASSHQTQQLACQL
jgi:hypothetical protein